MNEILDILTPQEIGTRLKLARHGLNLTQTEVAQIIGSTQLQISKIEQGKSVVTPIFIRLLAFYSQTISLDVLFGEKIDFLTHEYLFDKSFMLTKAVKEKLLVLRQSVDRTIQQLQDQTVRSIDQAIDLL